MHGVVKFMKYHGVAQGPVLSASATSSRNRLLQAWAVCMCLVYNTTAVVHNLTLGLATGLVMDL